MRTTLIAMACLASCAAMAGTVDVKFIKPETFTDARDNLMRRDEVLATLADHLKQLGAKGLPAGQTLKIEVTDIDLAGHVFPRTPTEVRVLKGRADWPRIDLRYTLSEGDKVLGSGEEHLSDMNYLMNRPYGQLASSPFPYETRMLDVWFNERFAAAKKP